MPLHTRTAVKREFAAPVADSLGTIIGALKSASARRINEVRRTPGAPVWQRGYYEHVICSQRELDVFRSYIVENPLRWAIDDENPTLHRYA